MARFDAQDGLLHFVFARSNDSYLLDSLVRMDLQDYLFYNLKNQGYRGIYFIRATGGGQQLEILDQESHKRYVRNRERSLFAKLLFGQEQETFHGRKALLLAEPVEFAAQMLRMLRQEQDMAFVFEIHAFSGLFGQCVEQLDQLIENSAACRNQARNIIVIQSPVTSSDSLTELAGENSLFRRTRNGKSLCPELYSILEKTGYVPLYDKMAAELGRRYWFLNEFTEENLENIALRHCLITDKTGRYTTGEIRDTADFLYAWYHSPQLRGETGAMLSENEYYNFSMLQKDLSEYWRSVQRKVAEWRKKCPQGRLLLYLRAKYSMEETGLYIVSDDELAKKLRSIPFPAELYQGQSRETVQEAKDSFNHVVADYQKPGSQLISQELRRILSHCIEVMENAVLRKDQETFRKGLDMLQYAVSSQFSYQEQDQPLWACKKIVLDLEEQLGKDTDYIRERRKERAEADKRSRELQAQYHMTREEVLTAVRTKSTKLVQAFWIKEAMDQALSAAVAVENRVGIMLRSQADLNRYRTSIHHLESQIRLSSTDSSRVEQVNQELRELAEQMEQGLEKERQNAAFVEHTNNMMDLQILDDQAAADFDAEAYLKNYDRLMAEQPPEENPEQTETQQELLEIMSDFGL